MISSSIAQTAKQSPPSFQSLLGSPDVGGTRDHSASWSLPHCCQPPKEPVVLGLLEPGLPLRSDRSILASPHAISDAAKFMMPSDLRSSAPGMIPAPQGTFCSAVASKLQDLLVWLVQQHEMEIAALRSGSELLDQNRSRVLPQLVVPSEHAQVLNRVSEESERATKLQVQGDFRFRPTTPEPMKKRGDESQDLLSDMKAQRESMPNDGGDSSPVRMSINSTAEENHNSRHSQGSCEQTGMQHTISLGIRSSQQTDAELRTSMACFDSIDPSADASASLEAATESKAVRIGCVDYDEDVTSDVARGDTSPRVGCFTSGITNVTTVTSGSGGKPWLKVRVISASGLRKADITSHSDPYCVIEIPGKSECKFQTTVINDTENPIWEQEFELRDYDVGDAIKFTVFDKDVFTDECLGHAELKTTQFFPAGYHGELLLVEGDWAEVGRRACLLVRVHVCGTGLMLSDGVRSFKRPDGGVYRINDVWKTRRASPGKISPMHATRTGGMEKLSSFGLRSTETTRSLSNVAKAEAAKAGKWYLLHPLSYKRYLWEIVGVLFVCHDIVWVPVEIFFHWPCTALRCVIAWCHATFWTLDIFLSFFTGAYRNGVIQFRHKTIAAIYLRDWFLMDFLLVLVGWVYVFAELGSDHQAGNVVVDFFGALRVLYFIRIAKVSKYTDLLSAVGLFSIVVSAVCFHFVSCAWYGLGRASSNGWIHQSNIHADGDFDRYWLSVCWMLSLASGRSISSFDAEALHVAERMFVAATSFISFFLTAWISGHITAHVIAVTDSKMSKIHQTCCRYLQDRRIPPELAVRTRKSVTAHQRKHFLEKRAQHETEMLMMLPSTLQAELCEAARAPALLNLQVMFDIQEVDRRVIRKICHKAVREQTCLKGLRVFSNFDACVDVYVVENGCLEYWRGANKSASAYFQGEVRQAATNNAKEDLFASLVHKGQILCEPSLWTSWNHCGDLDAVKDAVLLTMKFSDFGEIITTSSTQDLASDVSKYARLYVQELNRTLVLSDLMTLSLSLDSVDEDLTDSQDHLIFLSHYKVEAGTEATLMREAAERMIADDPDNPAQVFKAPIFIDSEDLTDLSKLKEHVTRSHNIVLLLTPGVLSRPWCLVEIVTAVKHSVPIVPVEVQRPGSKFVYPSDEFYTGVRSGNALSKECLKLLKAEGISLGAVEKSIRKVFQKIALPFSPHKTSNVRSAELEDILKRCSLKPIRASKPQNVPRAATKTSFASSIAEKVRSSSSAIAMRRSMLTAT